MMRVPGRKTLRRAVRPLKRTFFPGAVVLGYHRVAQSGWDPLALAVSPENFRAQLGVLKSLRQIISLAELAARHAAGERLERYAVLTFDDGYVDFAETVVPIAAEAGVPVTVFVASGFTGRDFWWEEIAALLLPAVGRASVLEFGLNGAESVRFENLERSEARHAAARDICNLLACRSGTEIKGVLDQLRVWASDQPAVSGRPMTRSELAAVTREPHVEIGAHTLSHGCLARLPLEVQREEIAASKSDLEAACGTEIRTFSYPNGSLSAETPGLVAAAGFACACTSLDGMLTARDDPYRIPRLWVSDTGGPEFRRWLANWVVDRLPG